MNIIILCMGRSKCYICIYAIKYQEVLYLMHCGLVFFFVERAKALCNLGTTYTHLCKFDKAEEHLQQALEIAENQFDVKSHTWAIRTTEILEKLGTMKRRKGEVNESLNLLMQCVKLKNEHYFYINHPG